MSKPVTDNINNNIRELHHYIGELQKALCHSNNIVRQRVQSDMYDEFLLKSDNLLKQGGYKS